MFSRFVSPKSLRAFYHKHTGPFIFAALCSLSALSMLFFDKDVALLLEGCSQQKIGYVFKAVSQLADFRFCFPILGIVWFVYLVLAGFSRSADAFYYYLVRARQTLYIGSSFLIASAIAQFLRFAVGRYSPRLWFSKDLYGASPFLTDISGSFPSLHVALMTAILCSLLNMASRFRMFYIFWIVMIAMSRLFLELNYMSDVIFGMMIGSLVSNSLYPFFKKFIGVYKK